MDIPEEEEEEENFCLPHVFSNQTIPLTWLWMFLNSHNVLNYVTLVNANNCTAW
jgi:hypothetical protein